MCLNLDISAPNGTERLLEKIFVTFVTDEVISPLARGFRHVTNSVTKFFFVTFVTNCDKAPRGLCHRVLGCCLLSNIRALIHPLQSVNR